MRIEINRLAEELSTADETKIVDLSQRITTIRREMTATPQESHTISKPSGVTIMARQACSLSGSDDSCPPGGMTKDRGVPLLLG